MCGVNGPNLPGDIPPDRWQQLPCVSCKPLFTVFSVIKKSGPHPSRVHWLLRASPKAEWGREGSKGGVEAAEEWEMRGKRWLFGWKTKRLFKALALRPACPSVLLWGGSAPRSSWACGQLYAKLRPLGGKTDLEQQCCTEVVGGFLL